jgi:hypothetical protein
MYSLAYPVTLPDDHTFHVDDRTPVPPVASFTISCNQHQRGNPQVFSFHGFSDPAAAEQFSKRLADAFLCASLALPHGFRLPDRPLNVTERRHYDGWTPTVYPSKINATAVTANAFMTSSVHLVTLARQLDFELQSGAVDRVSNSAELALAIRLFSESVFAGGETARFVVLLSALEVLVDANRGSKRGAIRKLVFQVMKASGRTDAKVVGNQIDALYKARNALIHEARPVSVGLVQELEAVVRDTLRCLADGQYTNRLRGSANSRLTHSP